MHTRASAIGWQLRSDAYSEWTEIPHVSEFHLQILRLGLGLRTVLDRSHYPTLSRSRQCFLVYYRAIRALVNDNILWERR
jgi:hypothetical protein